jgi:hypothetical protein
MKTLTLDLPVLYGDHHVLEVRRILQALEGIEDVYASSCFRLAEITYDPARIDPDTIKSRLDEAGYLRDLTFPIEAWQASPEQNGSDSFFRHTAVYPPTGMTVGFAQQVAYTGRPLWPCPGIGAIQAMDEED